MANENYLLQRELDQDQAARILDVLRGVEGLKLNYQRTFPLSVDTKKRIDAIAMQHKESLEQEVYGVLSTDLSLAAGVFDRSSVDAIIVQIDTVGPNFDEDHVYHYDRAEMLGVETVTFPMNLNDMSGSEAVNSEFSMVTGVLRSIEGRPAYARIVTIENIPPENVPPWNLGTSYRLTVHDFDLAHAKDAKEEAQSITSQLEAVL